MKLVQRDLQAARLIYAGRQHHHRILVKNNLQFEPHVANHFENRRCEWLPCGHDALAYREWLYAAASQFGDKLRRRQVGKYFTLAVGRPMQYGAVLCNDSLKERVLRENALQFGKLASGC